MIVIITIIIALIGHWYAFIKGSSALLNLVEEKLKPSARDRFNAGIQLQWSKLKNSTSGIFGKNESKVILQLYTKSLKKSKSTWLFALNLSMVFTSTAYLLGSIIYVIKSSLSFNNNLDKVSILIYLFQIIFYVLIMNQLLGVLFSKALRPKVIFNWLLRFTYFIFLRDSIVTPALNLIFSIENDYLNFSLPLAISGTVALLLFEFLLSWNKKYSIKRFITFLLLLVVLITLSKWLDRFYFLSFAGTLYLGFNFWIINFIFDLLTVFATVYFLRKIARSTSEVKNLLYIMADLVVAFSIASLLYFLLPTINNFVTHLIYYREILPLTENIDKTKAILTLAVKDGRFLHLLYCYSTLIPSLLYLLILLTRKISIRVLKFVLNPIVGNFDYSPLQLVLISISFFSISASFLCSIILIFKT